MNEKEIDNKTLAFLSDWRVRAKAQQRRNLIAFVVSFVVLFMICFAFTIWFQKKNSERISEQNMKYVQDGALQETNQVERSLQKSVTIAQYFANQYADLSVANKDATIEERLLQLRDSSLFDRIAYISSDGYDTSLEGNTDVSDRSYYQKAMKGNSGWEFLAKSRVTGRPCVIFYAPIFVDGKVDGVLVGFYEEERLEGLFSYEYFNYVPRSYLLRGDGQYIAGSIGEEHEENYLEVISKREYVGDVDYDKILEAIEDDERTTITFSFRENGAISVGTIVQFSQSDWMILSIMPYDVTEQMVEKANHTGWVFLGAIAASFALALLVLLLFFSTMNKRYQNEMSVAVDSLRATMENEQMQFSVIKSLANTYCSVYLVDGGKYERIQEEDVSVLDIPNQGDWEKSVQFYCDTFVNEASREEVRSFMLSGIYGWDTDDSEAEERGLELGDLLYETKDIEYQRIDGGWRRAKLIPVEQDEDKVTSFIFASQVMDKEKMREIATRQALEEAYEAAQLASNAKTRFLSDMSHDIRTPMNAIVGMTAIAAANIDNQEKLSDCLRKINISSKHLLGLINEVLDMSKIESGKVDLCEEDFSLPELIDTLVSLNMPLINEKNHTLMVTVKNVTHERVVGDSTRLQQVLTNLLTNAIKYTPPGGKIEVFVTEKDNSKPTSGWYEVSIKDNGIGISEEFQKHIFEPFARAEDNRIANVQGTGLGMAIARNIVRMMNGDITLESKLNEGSTFTVSFILRVHQDEEVNYDEFVDLPVLVVDDDQDTCESTCLLLDSLKMNSEWALSGKTAIEKLVQRHEQEKDFYAVILDWKMPDMDGVEVTREIRKSVGEDIPIIIVSAYDWSDIETEARAAGANGFISKPLFKSKIVDLFSGLLSDKSKDVAETLAPPQDSKVFEGKRILLVEDNEMNREIAVELLTAVGCEMETAENGKVGFDMFEGSKPGYYDLILMDIQMPVMNGYEATESIRALDRPDAKSIPIVALTANAFSSDVRSAERAGMNAHLPKPIDIRRVIEVLRKQMKMDTK